MDVETISDRGFRSTPSPVKAKWELGWHAPDDLLKIAVFDHRHSTAKQRRGASEILRQKVKRVEAAMGLPTNPEGIVRRNRLRSISWSRRSSSGKHLNFFRNLVRCVILLVRCFRMRRKFAVQSDDLTYTHHERVVDFSSPEKSSLSWEMRMIFSTPPSLRKEEDLVMVVRFLRSCGAVRAMLGQTVTDSDIELARYAAYEKYESGRVLAQQGRSPDRFFFVMSGKIMVVQEYHVANSVISKTIGVLGKGCTTNVDEMEKESERRQTLLCRGTVEAIVLDKDDYFKLRESEIGGAKAFLVDHHFFRLFPSEVLRNDSNVLSLKYFPNGSVIFPGGRDYEWIYIIKTGECTLARSQMVSNVLSQKKSLFNKQTPEELGCDRGRNMRSSSEPLADFRMWKRGGVVNSWHKDRNKETASTFKSGSSVWSDRSKSPTSLASQSSENLVNGHGAKKSTTLPSILKSASQVVNGNHDVIVEEEESRSPSRQITTVINPIDASMAGVTRAETGSARLLLSRSRMSASFATQNRFETRSKVSSRSQRQISSAPPVLRRTHLELGRLKANDVFGLDDLFNGPDDVTRIALISNGADVVLMRRTFFLRHAPANLLIQLSGVNHDFPTIAEARAIHETAETWKMYKNSYINLLTSARKSDKNLQRPFTAAESKTRRATSSYRHRGIVNSRLSRSFQHPAKYSPQNFERNISSAPAISRTIGGSSKLSSNGRFATRRDIHYASLN